MASAMGKEMAKICLLEMFTCKEGVLLDSLIIHKSTTSFRKELSLFLYHCIRLYIMAKKKIGLYSTLESSFNNKVEDLYLIVDNEQIIFSVKNNTNGQFVAFEHFVNSPDNVGWHQLIAYLQNNSKLIQSIFNNVFFVWNSARYLLTKKQIKEDTLLYQQELDLVHGMSSEEELYLKQLDDNKMLVFSVPDALSTLLSRTFPTGKWHHFAEFVFTIPVQNAALVFLFDNSFYLRLVKEGKTKLINTYPMEGADQNCYTILNTGTNVFTDLGQTELFVWGSSQAKDEFINGVLPYFSSFQLVNIENGSIAHSLNTNYPNHIYSPYFIF